MSVSEVASLTVKLPRSVVDQLKSLAEATERDVSELAEEAVANYLAVQQWQIAAIAEAVAELEAGAPTIAHDDVVAWVQSWETPDELPPPA